MKKKNYIVPQVEALPLGPAGILMGSTTPPDDPSSSSTPAPGRRPDLF